MLTETEIQRQIDAARIRWSDAAARALNAANGRKCAYCGKSVKDAVSIGVQGSRAKIHDSCFVRWLRSVEPEAYDGLVGKEA